MAAIQTRTQRLITVFTSVIFACVAMYFLMQNAGFLTICTGVCMFLFAMVLLSESFKILSGGFLNEFLDRVAGKNWKSFTFGFTLSTLLQSSGLVTIIAISFLSAGLLSLSSGVAMIYGVNLSTACSAWILGYLGVKSKIALLAMPFIIFGVVLYLNKKKQVRGAGLFLLSLGLLFLGISWMKDGFVYFKETIDISQYQISGFKGLLVYTVVGFAVTCVTQSSHATLTLAIAALTVNQITYENSIGIAIGASIGSTMLTVIGALNSNIEGKKIAVTHVFFNVFAAILAIVFIKYYGMATDWIAPMIGISLDDYVFRLAIFMTIFNVVATVILTPFISQMCTFLNRYVVSSNKGGDVERAKYLSESAIEFSGSALKTLNQETRRLMQNSMDIISRMICIRPEDIDSLSAASTIVPQRDEPIEEDFNELYQKHFKGIYSDIIDFAVRANSVEKEHKHATEFMDIRRANLFMAAALKDTQQLNTNVMKYAFANDPNVKSEYSHIRRNMLRMLRLVKRLLQAQTAEEVQMIKAELDKNKMKFDAVSSNSLDSLIRNKLITDSVATSIMNDNALSLSIAKSLRHAAEIISGNEDPYHKH